MAAGTERVDDAALVSALRAGDSQAFETIVRANGSRMLSVAQRILGNREDALDAVQAAFISAYRSRAQFQGDAQISTWLHRIAVNSALMVLRSRRRRAEDSLDALLPEFQPNGHHTEQFQSWDEPADVTLGRRETAESVRRAIDQLPETYRTVLMLRDIEGLSTKEAADALDVTENAVKIRLHRARMALRTLIAPEFQRGAA